MAAAVLAAHLFGVTMPLPVCPVVLALFAVTQICTLLALFVLPGGTCEDSIGVLGRQGGLRLPRRGSRLRLLARTALDGRRYGAGGDEAERGPSR